MPSKVEQPAGLRRLSVLLGVGGLLMGQSPHLAHAQVSPLEEEVEAAYIEKLPQFVHWPAFALASGNFVLCLMGKSASGPPVDQVVAGDSVQQHPVVVRHVDQPGAVAGCHMLFIDGEPPTVVSRALALAHGKPILTITDDQTQPGTIGIINFVLVDGRVRFQVNRAEATASGLDISSKLLSVAVG